MQPARISGILEAKQRAARVRATAHCCGANAQAMSSGRVQKK
jgi:hypothetical protein